jgi:hypothetical protein
MRLGIDLTTHRYSCPSTHPMLNSTTSGQLKPFFSRMLGAIRGSITVSCSAANSAGRSQYDFIPLSFGHTRVAQQGLTAVRA